MPEGLKKYLTREVVSANRRPLESGGKNLTTKDKNKMVLIII